MAFIKSEQKLFFNVSHFNSRELKNIYIFDEHGSSTQNGIGTYIRALTSCLKNVANVFVLSFNDSVSFFTKETIDGICLYRFPLYCNGSFLNNTEPGLAAVRFEIIDSANNIFIINHFVCTRLLLNLRRFYPLSKQVFVIHDQLWTETICGDETLLKETTNPTIRQLVEIEREMYALADAIVCLNKNTRTLLHEEYKIPPEKVFFIPSGLKYEEKFRTTRALAREKLHIDSTDQLFLYVGRTTKFKGIHNTLAAFEKLVTIYPKARLAVLGQIYTLEEFTPLCPNSISRIIFAGQVSMDKLYEWYAAADFGLLVSYYEQCGYAGVEMMANSLPVVASDALGVRCLFRHGYNAFIAPIGDRTNPEITRNNLTAAMVHAIETDSIKRGQMGANGLKLFKKKYTIEQMRNGYAQMFNIICDKNKERDTEKHIKPNIPNKERLYHILLHCCEITDNGLYEGKMGIVLALATYARQMKFKAIEDFACYLLQRTLHSLHKNMPSIFADGLCGMGWGIEYLVQNGFIHGDTKDICEEIDKKITELSPLRITDLSRESGIEGLLMYVNAHMANNRNKNVFSTSFLSELQTVALNTQKTSSSLNKQKDIFLSLRNGESPFIDMSLQQFIDPPKGNVINWNNLGLHKGLAGLLLQPQRFVITH